MDDKGLIPAHGLKIGGSAVAALAVAVAAWTWARGGPADVGVLPYRDKAAVSQGAELYQGYCASCHGAGLEGAPDWRQRDAEGYLPAPPHDASGHTWHHPDGQLIAVTTYGSASVAGAGYKSRMAGYGDVLSDSEILNVLAYIKSTWPEEVIRKHDEITAAARG